MLLYYFPNAIGVVAGFFFPLRGRIDAQVVLPVIERLLVKELMFGNNGAVKKSNGIVGSEPQSLAEKLVSGAEIVLPVFLLAALEVSRGEIGEDGRRMGLQFQGSAQGFNRCVVFALQQVCLRFRLQPGWVGRM